MALGLETALQWENVLVCLIGVTLGTAVGVLPGIGATATVALLLPITFNFDAVASLIMLAGIYYGAQYGGSTTAILINLPGESSAAVTAIDGHEMAKRGRAGPARPVDDDPALLRRPSGLLAGGDEQAKQLFVHLLNRVGLHLRRILRLRFARDRVVVVKARRPG